MPSPIVSCEWLNQQLDSVIVLDATVPKATGNNSSGKDKKVIPGAIYFDLNGAFSDESSDLPHMMASEAKFNKSAQEIGISNDDTIIVYDDHGIYSSPRVWWMLKAMGHKKVFVLNGGLPEWINIGYSTTDQHTISESKGNFNGTFNSVFFKNASNVLSSIDDPTHQVIDARSAGRFKGTEPEPRSGLRSGHIPDSGNIPFPDLLRGNRLSDSKTLRSFFDPLVTGKQAITFSCGSGLTACILALALEESEVMTGSVSVYDGSWSEWGGDKSLPIEN